MRGVSRLTYIVHIVDQNSAKFLSFHAPKILKTFCSHLRALEPFTKTFYFVFVCLFAYCYFVYFSFVAVVCLFVCFFGWLLFFFY